MFKSKCEVNKGFAVKARLGLLSPLYRLKQGPTALRAFRSPAAARASKFSVLDLGFELVSCKITKRCVLTIRETFKYKGYLGS